MNDSGARTHASMNISEVYRHKVVIEITRGQRGFLLSPPFVRGVVRRSSVRPLHTNILLNTNA